MLEVNRHTSMNRPEKVLESFVSLYPFLSQALKKCDLTINEFFILSYLNHFGRPYSNNRKVIMRSELGGALGCMVSEGAVSNVIKRLIEKGLIKRKGLTVDEKKDIYDAEGGSSVAVVIRKKGLKKIHELKDTLNEVFLENGSDTLPFSKQPEFLFNNKELKH